MSLIYVVEDNKYLLSDSVGWLNKHGHDCYGAQEANEFDALMDIQVADLVVLDWMLPGEQGIAIAQRLRASPKTKNIGVVFMTARSDINDRIEGHDVADAYLTKPINYAEFSAVINAVLRRINQHDESVLSWQLFVQKMHMHSPCGKAIPLTWRECAILSLLAQNPIEQVTSQALVAAIKENWLSFEKNRLEMLLSRLRSKLKLNNDTNVNPIRSYRNKGYRLMLPFEIKD